MIWEIVFYVGFAVALGLGVWLAQKYRVTATEVKTLLNLITLMKFVNRQVDYRLQDDLEHVLDYVASWANFLMPYTEKNDYTYAELYEAFMFDTDKFCAKEGITVDAELKGILDLVADFVIRYWLGV